MDFRFFRLGLASIVAMGSLLAGSTAHAGKQEAIDGCIDKLRVVGGPDGKSGEVLSADFSEAATIVMLKDRGGTVWRCHAYSDGAVEEIKAVDVADDGNGAMAGSGEGGELRVSFPAGSTGTEIQGKLAPGQSMRYILGAKDGQFLDVRVTHKNGPRTEFQIFNPDGSFLLDMILTDKPYRGQLWQTGDHVVEVINRKGNIAEFSVIFGIE